MRWYVKFRNFRATREAVSSATRATPVGLISRQDLSSSAVCSMRPLRCGSAAEIVATSVFGSQKNFTVMPPIFNSSWGLACSETIYKLRVRINIPFIILQLLRELVLLVLHIHLSLYHFSLHYLHFFSSFRTRSCCRLMLFFMIRHICGRVAELIISIYVLVSCLSFF